MTSGPAPEVLFPITIVKINPAESIEKLFPHQQKCVPMTKALLAVSAISLLIANLYSGSGVVAPIRF